MTREEKDWEIGILRGIERGIQIFLQSGEDTITLSADVETAKMLAAALRGPEPDPDTGIMRCGCGWKVRVECYPEWAGMSKAYQVDCFNCHVGTTPCQTAEQAKIAWNRAMGWRVEE